MVTIRKINEDGEPEDRAPDPRDVEIDSLRAEVSGLSALVRRVLADRDAPVAKPEPPQLEPVENERARILAAWAAEPRVSIFIAPDENDQRAANDMAAKTGKASEFPPRVFKVNGVELAVSVGQSVTVPESIGALYEYTLNPWKSQHKVKPLTFDQIEARMG